MSTSSMGRGNRRRGRMYTDESGLDATLSGLGTITESPSNSAQFTTPSPPPQRTASASKQPSFRPAPSFSANDNTTATPRTTFWKRLRQSQHFKAKIAALIDTRVWLVLLVLFTMLLLFGLQLQTLVFPKSLDLVFDILYLLAFLFFIVDMGMRVLVEPDYFGIHMEFRRGSSAHDNLSTWGRWKVGSFVFWCDVVSTLSLLYGISYVHAGYFDIVSMELTLDQFGIVVDDGNSSSQRTPYGVDVDMLVTIAKIARAARFIRSSAVLRVSSQFSYYKTAVMRQLSPTWQYRRYRARQEFASIKKAGFVLEKNWEGLQLGVIAAMRLQQAKEKEEEEAQKRSAFANHVRKCLRSIGLMPDHRDQRENVLRQIAATKIQRKWRAKYGKPGVYDPTTSIRSVAWDGRPAANNALEKKLGRRSKLREYAATNTRFRASAGEDQRQGTGKGSLLAAAGSLGTSWKSRDESHVGNAMRELTGQRVALGIIVTLALTVLFTYIEDNTTRLTCMVTLHSQTSNPRFGYDSLEAARVRTIPDLFEYRFQNGTLAEFTVPGEDLSDLRDRETLEITVIDIFGGETWGRFAYRNEREESALVELFSCIFILLIWFFGVAAFSGPIMTLVVIPIERMVQLLDLMMLDPLGYQGSAKYRKIIKKDDELTKNTMWTEEALKGMETSFLMSTILRIGSLMKVGFGSAGVEIIRHNLAKGQSNNMLILDSEGSAVSCIFLFCDIRQFTDATECLQEEVFVFTNRIAAVVHSICHSYGGSANKNVGDAFLLSWILDDDHTKGSGGHLTSSLGETVVANNHQADKALLSVVKICMALHHDKFYIETMNEIARDALLKKLKNRRGPVVKMGFGLHAGKAVQGAIGSQRKIDATYVSEAVEKAELLESLTKKYGLSLLMSDSFHGLLHPGTRRRCRKVDQIIIQREEDDDEDLTAIDHGDIMELLTFDMDIEALWRPRKKDPESTSESGSKELTAKNTSMRGGLLKSRRRSMKGLSKFADAPSTEFGKSMTMSVEPNSPNSNTTPAEKEEQSWSPPELVLPTGASLYVQSVWTSEEFKIIREHYTDGIFFSTFNSGLQNFYSRQWDQAKVCFQTILDRFEDGPSRYFMKQIEQHNGIPPQSFLGYGTV